MPIVLNYVIWSIIDTHNIYIYSILIFIIKPIAEFDFITTGLNNMSSININLINYCNIFFIFCNSDLYYKCKCCKDILMQIFLFLVVTKNKTFHRKHHVIDMLYKFPFFRLIKCVTCLVQVIQIWVIQIWHGYILILVCNLWGYTVTWHQYDSSELGEELCPMSSSLPLSVHKLYIRVSFSDTFLRWLPPYVVSIAVIISREITFQL